MAGSFCNAWLGGGCFNVRRLSPDQPELTRQEYLYITGCGAGFTKFPNSLIASLRWEKGENEGENLRRAKTAIQRGLIARRAEKNGVRVVAIGCATLILGKALQFGSAPLGPDLEPNKVIAFATAHQEKACFALNPEETCLL